MALDGSCPHDRASQLDATDASLDEVATVSNMVLLLDANGRVGQDYRCTESHETANEWVSVGLTALKLLLRTENGWS